MSNLKMFGAVGVMVVCFAIVYPRFMHPLVLRGLGLYEPPKKNTEQNMYPPNFKAMHPEHKKSAAEDVRKHMRPGPHPGMRAAAEMQRQQAQQGSGRGMMGIVLPMYAIGIVLYLIYTLFKVFNKSKNNSWSTPGGGQYNRRGQRGAPLDRMGFPADYDGSGDVRTFLNDQQQRQELEDLLSRVDDKNVSIEEMRALQKRLEETEAQMTRILRAMQSVQTNVDKFTPSQEQMNDLNQGEETQEVEKEEEGEDNQETGEMSDKMNKETKDDSKGKESKKENHESQNTPNRERQGKKEVDLDGIDKESDENNADSGEEEEGQNEDDNEGAENKETEGRLAQRDEDEDTETNVRQRKKNP